MGEIKMNAIAWLTGAGVGAGLMYWLDPDRGARRRGLLRDQAVHAISQARKAADTTWRDAKHRTSGSIAALHFTGKNSATDEVLVERVRSKMGRYVSHPASIEVAASGGHVTLSGLILAHEVDELLQAVNSVKGVREVENRLEVHKTPENISGLQGGVRRTGEPAELMQENWSPTTRLAAGTAGCALMANCAIKRTPAAIVMGTLGFGLFARALVNIETRRLFGLGRSRRGIDLQKTITIQAPVEKVFALLADPQNYPHFTDMIEQVRDLGDGHYQKTVVGPAGTEIALDEIVTRLRPNEFLAWRSGPNSALKYAGRARFISLGDSATQVQIDMTYNPPGGIVSHSAAWLAGYDPKAVLDDVLMRAKSYLETGQQPHDARDQSPLEVESGLGAS